MKKLKLLHTLVVLDSSNDTMHVVYVNEDMIDRLVEEYDNDDVAWISECLADDIGIDFDNSTWMLVCGKVDTFEHRMVDGKWNRKRIDLV